MKISVPEALKGCHSVSVSANRLVRTSDAIHLDSSLDTVAIRNSERHMCKGSHCGSKQQ